MTMESVALKPGVLFVETLSGGILMDIDSDRFMALTPLSATVWGRLAAGEGLPEIIDRIAAVRAVDHDGAHALLSSQLQSWERADLINSRQPALPLPQANLSSPLPSTIEFPLDTVRSAPLDPRVLVSLYIAKLKYRRALAKVGLAKTLKALQAERRLSAKPQQCVIRNTLRSYYASRRAFKQGGQSRDCLLRSLALGAVLGRQGVDAELCMGIIDMPFSSHAWVEADGYILNDTARKCQYYRVIGRF